MDFFLTNKCSFMPRVFRLVYANFTTDLELEVPHLLMTSSYLKHTVQQKRNDENLTSLGGNFCQQKPCQYKSPGVPCLCVELSFHDMSQTAWFYYFSQGTPLHSSNCSVKSLQSLFSKDIFSGYLLQLRVEQLIFSFSCSGVKGVFCPYFQPELCHRNNLPLSHYDDGENTVKGLGLLNSCWPLKMLQT